MSELRHIKYEMFIKNINEKIQKRNIAGALAEAAVSVAQLVHGMQKEGDLDLIGNTSLLTIYDYDNLNDLAKIIVLNSKLFISGIGDESKNLWNEKYCDKSQFKDVKDKIIATRYLVKMCSLEQNRSEAYKFVFWALMVLTVDKTDAEEHLSLICDFAKMLGITEDEIEDIVHIIERIYDEPDNQYHFKTKMIPQIFGGVLENYVNNENVKSSTKKDTLKKAVSKDTDPTTTQSTIPKGIYIPDFLRRQ